MSAALIHQRRAQMLVHSYAYYEMDTPIVSDDTWQRWADELVRLQSASAENIGFYDPEFAGWDGSTGMHLPRDGWVAGVTAHLLALHERFKLPPPAIAIMAPVTAAQAALF